ncbi:hypothetical protein ACFOON_04020 [Novosphingobium piscinae]|uniref:Uncharacterized protein n=1 Tax=Novosphingobium piscinae TaxID=1507448 RepID=A0A7X1G090_9SPHN|nr:hypothetical protein [Novosphingobium piscinae]MBC2670251.1 hypothetical protein [Novosphingobium piscinae]
MAESEAARAARRADIERALARYPHLNPAALAELTNYFTTEASALDVGLIASNPDVTAAYCQFRADHLDRLRLADWLRGLAVAAALGAVLLGLLWPAF